jgi:hypothetical protein
VNSRITQHQEVVGSWVVVDPTGRDLPECFEVGRVESVRWDDSDDGNEAGDPRPLLTVRLNTFGDEGDNVIAVTHVEQVLRRGGGA